MRSRYETDMRRQASLNPNDRSARRETRNQLLGNGIPAGRVDEVVDLAFHASQRALESLHDVVFSSADPRVAITALGVAIGVAKARLEDQEKALVELAGTAGLPTRSIVVEATNG